MNRSFDHWILEKYNYIATLTLNRAESKNTMDATTLSELSTISKIIDRDEDIWVVFVNACDPFLAIYIILYLSQFQGF